MCPFCSLELYSLTVQDTHGNVFAGMFLAISRIFRVGDEMIVLENQGKVAETGLMPTLNGSGDEWVIVPSNVPMTNVLGRKKEQITEATAQENTMKLVSPWEKAMGI